MKEINILLSIVLAIMILPNCTNQELNTVESISVIPLPKKITIEKGMFKLKANTKIIVPAGNEEIRAIGEFLSDLLATPTDFDIELKEKVDSKRKLNSIILKIDTSLFVNNEGYHLSIKPKSIVISAKATSGLFYGIQTLRQLLPNEVEHASVVPQAIWSVPCFEIKDEPRFSYRGILLDVARHFYPKEFIKKYIELLSLYKYNYLQLHLTDDQGWRIEIKKYPKLTEIGSFRDETLVGHFRDQPYQYDGEMYGGFYSQEDIKEIVAHAKKYFVEIIPEIEMPGHSVAALTAYPELGCIGGPYSVRTRWGISKDVQCAGNENTFKFIEDVITEVAALFPSKYIHIGGDECPKDRWKECPKCQARIKEEGLKDEHELQSYFIKRAEKILKANGKKLIGWDEILEGGLAPEATVMSWRGVAGGTEAAKLNHNVIMTPYTHCYFDYYQSKDRSNEPLAIGGYIPIERVYSYEPIPEKLTDYETKYILGAQANVWTEYITTSNHVEYMTFPRACAFSEVLWTPNSLKNYDNFITRMKQHSIRLKLLNVNAREIE